MAFRGDHVLSPLPCPREECDLERLDAVLPLWERDLDRARLLARTLSRFGHAISRLWLVAAEDVLERAVPMFAGIVETEGVPERAWVPELSHWRGLLRLPWNGSARPGYRAQQLIKLEAARWVETEFYLTLDADVVFTGEVAFDWLVREGRARSVRFPGANHGRWYRVAAEILGVSESRWEHGVTPCLLSRRCALGLQAFLEQPAGRRDAQVALASAHGVTGGWRSLLLRRNDWTEYTLYHTFVEHGDVFDQHHFAVPPEAWYGGNVWTAADWSSWHPEDVFAPDASHRFSVLGSKAGRSVDWIEGVVARFL